MLRCCGGGGEAIFSAGSSTLDACVRKVGRENVSPRVWCVQCALAANREWLEIVVDPVPQTPWVVDRQQFLEIATNRAAVRLHRFRSMPFPNAGSLSTHDAATALGKDRPRVKCYAVAFGLQGCGRGGLRKGT